MNLNDRLTRLEGQLLWDTENLPECVLIVVEDASKKTDKEPILITEINGMKRLDSEPWQAFKVRAIEAEKPNLIDKNAVPVLICNGNEREVATLNPSKVKKAPEYNTKKQETKK